VVRIEGDSYNWNYNLKEVVKTNKWIYLVKWGYVHLGLLWIYSWKRYLAGVSFWI